MAKLFSFCAVLIIVSCTPNTKEKKHDQTTSTIQKFDSVNELPKAIHYDTDLELDVITTMNAHQKQFMVNEIIITSDRWAMSFNALGHIVARSRSAVVIANLQDKCYLKEVIIEQKANNEDFGVTKVIKEKSWHEFDCKLQENKNPDTMAGVKFEEE